MNAAGRPYTTKLLSTTEALQVLPKLSENLSLGRAHLLQQALMQNHTKPRMSQTNRLFAISAFAPSEPESHHMVALCSTSPEGSAPEGSVAEGSVAEGSESDGSAPEGSAQGHVPAGPAINGWFTTGKDITNRTESVHCAAIGSLLHANFMQETDDGATKELTDLLKLRIDQEFRSRGVRLVYWITDPNVADPKPEGSTVNYSLPTPPSLGFEHLAIIHQMECSLPFPSRIAAPASLTDQSSTSDQSEIPSFHLKPLDWKSSSKRKSFSKLVAATYEGSHDAVALSRAQSTSETLENYTSAAYFDPRSWFTVVDDRSNLPVGCVILAQSRPEMDEQDPPRFGSRAEHEGLTSELVYLGLLPEFRGRRLGEWIIDEIAKLAVARGSQQLILAVDHENHPAMKLYRRIGLKTTLRESVWIRAIPPQAESLSPPTSSDQ